MSGLAAPGGGASDLAFSSPSSRVASRYQSGATAASSAARGTPPRPRPKPSGSSSSSASYEAYAPRTAEQRARLARIAALTAGPCFGDPSSDEQKTSDERVAFTLTEAMCPPKPKQDAGFDPAAGPSPAVDDSVARTLAMTVAQTNNLAALIKHCASLRLALHASLNIGNDVSRRHADLLRHSGELSAAAERLQAEEQLLTARAEEIGMPLQHYDAVDRFGPLFGVLFKEGGRYVVRGAPRLRVDDGDEFVDALGQVDDAVDFFAGSGGGVEAFGRPGGAGAAGRAAGGGRERLAARQAFDAGASGSAEYYRRACALQDAALELLRVGVADRISQTSAQIQDSLNLPKVPIAADKLEASLVYTRFHGISKRSNALIAIARKRLDALGNDGVAAASYEDLLALCRNAYCGAREALLTPTVRRHMDILKERHGLVGMTRLASVFLIRLCTVETALYLDFFGDPDKRRYPRKKAKGALAQVDEEGAEGAEGEAKEGEGSGEGGAVDKVPPSPMSPGFKRMGSSGSTSVPAASALASQILSEDATYRDAEFQSMLGNLCSALHRTVRRGLMSVLDLDVLCQVVGVLREERGAANSSPTTLAAARAVSGVISDAQERLIFCANGALHKEVVRFKPRAADLNYPGKLLGEKPKVAIVIEDESGSGEKGEEAKGGEREEARKDDPDDAVAAQLRVYESWFPPMRSVLRILSKIFRVVEPRVFEDIALQSVQSCTKSLKDGSFHVLRKSGQIHADLFLVKHLLILREQLSPFDIQLRSVERQLDFSEAGRAVTRFLANRNRRLFSMSTENALVTLLREGVSVQESSVDSKRDLEDCLRSACNDFIEHTTAALLGPIGGFVDQCKNATVGAAKSGGEALAAAPFANGAVVTGVFECALQNLDGELDNVSTQMSLYLENAATQGILMKPVVRKVTRSLDEAKRFVGEVSPTGEENGWDEETRSNVMKSIEEYEAKVKVASSKK